MSSGEVVTVLVALVGGGGVWNAVQKIIEARATRRDMRERQPEVMADSSVLRAQQALAVMEGSLNAAVSRAEAAEAEVRELRANIDQLERDIDSIRRQLTEATTQLGLATAQLTTLRAQIPPRSAPA